MARSSMKSASVAVGSQDAMASSKVWGSYPASKARPAKSSRISAGGRSADRYGVSVWKVTGGRRKKGWKGGPGRRGNGDSADSGEALTGKDWAAHLRSLRTW